MKEEQKVRVIGCKNCHKTSDLRITLIKAKDSYYCKDCFNYLLKKGQINRG